MYNYFVKFLLLCSSYTGPLAAEIDSGGWVALGPAIKKGSGEEARQEDDPSLWVIFSKQLGNENFMIRFPEDPAYTYLSPEEMQISASADGASYTLRVLQAASVEEMELRIKDLYLQSEMDVVKVDRPAENTFDIVLRKGGKSIAQRIFLTSQHVYILETENVIFHRENHQKFITSLDVAFS